MSGAVAPSLGAERGVADARTGDRGGCRRPSRMPVRPARLRIRARAVYSKEDVFGLCDILARAERALRGAGEPEEAALVAAAFDLVEAGLA